MGRKSNSRDKSTPSSSGGHNEIPDFGGVPTASGGFRNPNSSAPSLFDESAIISQAWSVFTFSLILRTLFCFLVVYGSVLTPDELFQGPEVAHRLAFGYGFLTFDWLPGTQIRSAIYPAVFAIPYKLLELLWIDSPGVITMVPLMVQSVLAATGDVFAYRLAFRLFGRATAQWAINLHLASFWLFLYATRTLTTSVEAVLFVVCLHYWPLPVTASKNLSIVQQYPPLTNIYSFPEITTNRMAMAMVLGVFSCIVRPTSVVPWIFLGIQFMWWQPTWKARGVLILLVLPSALYVLGLQVVIDRIFLGSWIFTSSKIAAAKIGVGFIKWVTTSVWYMTVGLASLTTTWYPLMLAGVYFARPHHRSLFWMMLFVCAVLALRKPAETRVISLLVSPAIVYAAYAAHVLLDPETDEEKERKHAGGPSGGAAPKEEAANKDKGSKPQGSSSEARVPKMWARYFIATLCLLNLFGAIYFLTFNQRGGTRAMGAVRNDVDLFRRYPGTLTGPNSVVVRKSPLMDNCTETGGFMEDNMEQIPIRVHIWAKCHQAPMYSHIHFPIEIIQLDCTPR